MNATLEDIEGDTIVVDTRDNHCFIEISDENGAAIALLDGEKLSAFIEPLQLALKEMAS